MHKHFVEEPNIEHFLKCFLPGSDPTAADFETFYYPPRVLTEDLQQQDVNLEICKLADSVFKRTQKGDARRIICSLVNRKVPHTDFDGESPHKRRGISSDPAIFFADQWHKTCLVPTSQQEPSFISKQTSSPPPERYPYADVVVPIKVKLRHYQCAFEFNDCSQHFTRDHTDRGLEALEQLCKHLSTIFGRQHRTHVLSLYVYCDSARMLYVDRDVCVVSAPFCYTTDPDSESDHTSLERHVLHRYLWRLAQMNNKQLGYDPTVTSATNDDFQAMFRFAVSTPGLTPYVREQLCHALCVDVTSPMATGYPVPTTDQWPLKRVARPNGTYVLIGRPKWASPSLFGRCTRGYVTYDKFKQEAYFMKDSWRVDHPAVKHEHEVYERLAAAGVENVLTCYGGEEVPENLSQHSAEGTKHKSQHTRTSDFADSPPKKPAEPTGTPAPNSDGVHNDPQSQEQASDPDAKSRKVRHSRVHYRIFIKEIGRPLVDFVDWRELLVFVTQALRAHRDAWVKANVLHRDVSVNNIIIVEVRSVNASGEEDVRRIAVLCDWDLCKYREQMGAGQRTPDRTGTWAFRSAMSLAYPLKPYHVSDDVESFIYVIHYLVLRFLETFQTQSLQYHYMAVFEEDKLVNDYRLGVQVHVGGQTKLQNMMLGTPLVLPRSNRTIVVVLKDLAALCAKHFALFDAQAMDQCYIPLSTPPRSFLQASTTRSVIEVERHLMQQMEASDVISHNVVIDILDKYTVETAEWRSEDLEKGDEDFFLQENIVPRHNNAFTASAEPHHSTPTTDSSSNGI